MSVSLLPHGSSAANGSRDITLPIIQQQSSPNRTRENAMSSAVSSSWTLPQRNIAAASSSETTFGYMLDPGGMDEDQLTHPSLVSQPRSDTSSATIAGQTRHPSGFNFGREISYPRNAHALGGTWVGNVPVPVQQYQRRPHQRTVSLESASEGSDISSASSSMPSEPEGKPELKTGAKRKEIEGDCSICWEPFEQEKNDLIWCKLTCGTNFHKNCFVEWLKTPKHQHHHPGQERTCPYCRGKWDQVELRTLQIDAGLQPARPTKRPRTGFSSRSFDRAQLRRMYRDRTQAQLSMRGDSYRPNYGPRTGPNTFHVPSMNTSVPSAGPSPAQSPMSTSPTSSFIPAFHSYPILPPAQGLLDSYRPPQISSSPPMQGDFYRPPQSSSSQFSNNYSVHHHQPYFPHHNPMPSMDLYPSPNQMPPQSHDLSGAQGFNTPAFASSSFLPPMNMSMRGQEHMGMGAFSSRSQMASRCPAMQAHQQRRVPLDHDFSGYIPVPMTMMPSNMGYGGLPMLYETRVDHFHYSMRPAMP